MANQAKVTSFDALELLVRHEESPRGRWINAHGRPLREKGGAIKGGVLVCREITNRKRDERQAESNAPGKQKTTSNDVEQRVKRERILLARSRTVTSLESAQAQRYRTLLERTLEHLDSELAKLG